MKKKLFINRKYRKNKNYKINSPFSSNSSTKMKTSFPVCENAAEIHQLDMERYLKIEKIFFPIYRIIYIVFKNSLYLQKSLNTLFIL